MISGDKIFNQGIGRRALTKGAVVAAASALARPAFAVPRTIKLGLVVAKTGVLAGGFNGVPFLLEEIKRNLGGQVTIDGVHYPFEFVMRDSESNPNRASQVAEELILTEKVDVMLSWFTPNVVNPVADQCEVNGMPCVTTDDPLESYWFGRGAPKGGFQWTYNFFWSMGQVAKAYLREWDKIPTNKVIGALWPTVEEGRAWARTFPPLLKAAGYKVVDPGQFDLPSSYTAQILAFKAAGVEVVHGLLPPSQFVTFWNTAAQQRFQPKIVAIDEATEIPPVVTPLGKRAYNLSIEAWWTPGFPFTSPLTGMTSARLAASFEKATGKEWLMSLGGRYALFEVVFEALRRAGGAGNKAALREAVRGGKFETILGAIDFRSGPFPNTSEIPVVITQWRKGTKFPLDLLIVDNSNAPKIPVQTRPMPISYS